MTLRAALVLILALAFAISPAFSEFNGFDPDLYPVPQDDPPVQPAGWAFSIWGLIYLWLIAHAGFGLVRRRDDPDWDATRWPLIVSLAVGVPWLAVAGVSPLAATAMIWAMLGGALAALFAATSAKDRALLQPPLAIYAGWLTAASSVSIGLLLAGWGLLDRVTAAWAGLAVALTLAAAVQVRLHRAPEYGAVLDWALTAIAVKNWTTEPTLAWGAVAGAVIMTLLALRAVLQERVGRERFAGSSPA